MMKKQLLRTMLLLFALVAGGQSVWADITSPWSHTFSTTDKTFTADGTVELSGVEWTLAVTWAGSSKDYNKDSDKGMKIGSNSKVPTSMTLSTSGITGTITKVSVNTCGRSGGSCAVGVKVGTTVFTTTDEWGAATMTEMEFTGEASGAIEISWDQSAASSSKQGAFYVKDITVEFEEAGGGNKQVATWTVSPASATVAAGENVVLDLTTNYDGTLNFVSENDEVATASYNTSTKKITINGVAKGVTTINVTGAATATYKAISKNIAVTVTRTHPLGEVLYESVSSYSGSGDGNELTTNNAYLDYDGWASFTKVYPGKVLSGDADGNLKFGSKDYAGSAVTKPLALAGNATLTYKVQRYDSSNTGNLKVTVTGATATGDVDVEGTAAWVTKTVSITGGTGNVVITFATTDENTRIRVDDIQLVQTTAAATITAAGYATFVAPVAVDFSATSLEVYTAQVNGAKNGVMLNEVASKKVPANTAVILKGETAAGAVIATADALENNDLVAGPVTGDGESHYVLGKEGEKVGFGLLADGTELPANKAYIAASKFAAGAPAFMPFCFGGETTDLSEKVIVNSEKFLSEESVARNATAPVYNLAGQRVMNPSKGLFIMNGKKVAIK